MHKKWNVCQDVVILAGILISLSTADHRVCYLQSKCGECSLPARRSASMRVVASVITSSRRVII